MKKYMEIHVDDARFKTNDINVVKFLLYKRKINQSIVKDIEKLWFNYIDLSNNIVEYSKDNVFVIISENKNWLESKGHYIIPKGVSIISDIGYLQQEYSLMSKRKVPEEEISKFTIPFRRKYSLSEENVIDIARNQLSFLQIADILMKSAQL